jgi:hypothetical protein
VGAAEHYKRTWLDGPCASRCRVQLGDLRLIGTYTWKSHEIARAVVDQRGRRKRAMHTLAQAPALLKGLIFGPAGAAMSPAHTRRNGKLYRYYVSTDALKRDAASCPIRRVPAAEIENAVIDQLHGLLCAPEIVVRTWRAARQTGGDISESEVRQALERLDPLWDELFPAEQARIVQLLVGRVDISPHGADIRLRTKGLSSLAADLRAVRPESKRAA